MRKIVCLLSALAMAIEITIVGAGVAAADPSTPVVVASDLNNPGN